MVTNITSPNAETRERGARRRLKPAMRRAELLAAAIRMLQDRDPDTVRVDEVTQAAGTAKGNFYRYFPSWSDLLLAVREHFLAQYAGQVRQRLAAVEEHADAWAVLEMECIRFVDLLIDLGTLHKVLFHGPIADHPIDSPDSAETLVAEAIRAAMHRGACRRVDVDVVAPLLFSALHTTADEIAADGQRERRMTALLDMLRTWLRASNNEITSHGIGISAAEGTASE